MMAAFDMTTCRPVGRFFGEGVASEVMAHFGGLHVAVMGVDVRVSE